jgi:hypothetical protein
MTATGIVELRMFHRNSMAVGQANPTKSVRTAAASDGGVHRNISNASAMNQSAVRMVRSRRTNMVLTTVGA